MGRRGRGRAFHRHPRGHRLPGHARAAGGSLARIARRIVFWLVVLGLIAGAYVFGRDYVRRHPQDFPWTKLDLRHPTGTFTGSKLAQLGSDPALCRALLRDVGADERPVPPRSGGPNCGYRDGMRLGPEPIGFRPAGPVTSCSVAAGMFLLETRVIQPAARRHLGTDVAAIDHAGSYSCRRLYGRSEGSYSEHATADAIDILGFRLADGRRVSVLRDWHGNRAAARFLRDVRDGSCRFFSTVLSPDYNAAHADHLHLDQAERGSFGWRGCR